MKNKIMIGTGDRQYTKISNEWLQDGRLSFDARGLLAYLLSLQVDELGLEHFEAISKRDTKQVIEDAMAELKKYGYVTDQM